LEDGSCDVQTPVRTVQADIAPRSPEPEPKVETGILWQVQTDRPLNHGRPDSPLLEDLPLKRDDDPAPAEHLPVELLLQLDRDVTTCHAI
jgi:hypothetical protein